MFAPLYRKGETGAERFGREGSWFEPSTGLLGGHCAPSPPVRVGLAWVPTEKVSLGDGSEAVGPAAQVVGGLLRPAVSAGSRLCFEWAGLAFPRPGRPLGCGGVRGR